MLNCFFGAELKPDGVAVNFAVPKGSSLVITQCAVTSVVPAAPAASASPSSSSATTASAFSPVTLCVQGHGVPTRFAVCSLSPAQQITYCPLQLIFSKPVSFALVPQTVSATAAAAAANGKGQPPQVLRHVGKKAHREQRSGEAEGGVAAAAYPTVHLTGYYEQAADEDEDDGGMAMEVMEGSDEEGDFSGDE